ncbi:hypothetical protein NLI96_g6615 [Meripilus lineatus]|uniref:Uncharacterized protein n=1 Tax=Meripilus lineatus TaxID=2056292 RepID=A0AAD5YDQ3_9APHY|nr:hypothetical protein NLI96_g6615 [Physisporinus lineatus]
MLKPFIFLPFLAIAVVSAGNDWATPCFGGTCRYNQQSSGSSTLWTSLVINGSPAAISDITPAAGWTIVGCSPDSETQDIRLVCTGNPQDCAHLDKNGAVGTIVRLPEDCGPMPFARVANKWLSQDQTVPSSITAKFRGKSFTVHELALDTDFSSVDPSQNGEVTLYIQGSSASGNQVDFNTTTVTDGDIQARGLGDWIKEVLSGFAFNYTRSNTLPPISVQKAFTPFDQSISCPNFTAEVRIDVSASAVAEISYGIAAVGKLIPPELTEFGIFAGLDAELDGNLKLASTATALIDTGVVTVFQQGIPGLDIPGILSIGPVFKVNVEANGTADANVDLDVDLSYTVSNAKIFFPPQHGSSSGGFTPADTNLKLSVAPNASLQGAIEGHVIPTIEFGLSALGGIAKASIDLNLDTSANLDLSLQATSNSFAGCIDLSGGLATSSFSR